MEQKHQFVVVAVVLALLCLICQIHAIRLLMTRPQENPLSESAEPSVQSIATEQEATVKKHTDETSHHSRKLEKLDALEDFIAYSASELQMGEGSHPQKRSAIRQLADGRHDQGQLAGKER